MNLQVFVIVTLITLIISEDLLPLYIKEKGLSKLIHIYELISNRYYKQPCRLKEPTPGDEKLDWCINEELLTLPEKFVSFKEFVTMAPNFTTKGSMRLRQINPTYPYLSGALFRGIADQIQETKTHFQWDRSVGSHWKKMSWWVNFSMPNRSLVYWNLCAFKPDIKYLKQWLEEGRFKQHFFIISHNQDRPYYPDWLLDHPLILKVFGHHVPSDIVHPKIVPIPLGLASPTHPPTIMERVRHNVAGFPVYYKPVSIIFSRFRADLGADRPVIAKAVKDNFPNSSHSAISGNVPRKLNKAAFYRELAISKFVISPPGIGLESSKAWEALPVVSNKFNISTFQYLPYLSIEDWTTLTPKLLNDKWNNLLQDPIKRFNLHQMWSQWWIIYILRICLLTP